MKSWIALGSAGLLLLAAACSKQEEQKPAAPAAPAATAAAPAAPAAAPAGMANPHAGMPNAALGTPHAGMPPVGAMPAAGGMPPPPPNLPSSGVIKQVLQAGNYTYLEVENGGNLYWLAGNHVEFKVGDEVRWGAFSPMRNFQSKSLNRTFPLVLFVGSIESASAPVGVPANQGKVLQVIETTGYNYIEVENGGGKKWLAAPVGEVKQGQTVVWSGGTPMQNFTSKSLERTFPEIMFLAESPTQVQ